jgi:hypothetical protein
MKFTEIDCKDTCVFWKKYKTFCWAEILRLCMTNKFNIRNITTQHYLLTHSMEQSSSWEANRFSASHEIPHILWNPKVHYCIRKYLPPVPILSQLEPLHATTFHFLKIHLNPLAPRDPYMGRTAQLTSGRCILNTYSTNIRTEYFKHAA